MELRSKKISARGKVKIFFSTDVWFMVFKRSVFKMQKQRTKILKIRVMVAEQFMKTLQNCAIAQNGEILEHFHELLRNHNSDHYHFWCVVSVFNFFEMPHFTLCARVAL